MCISGYVQVAVYHIEHLKMDKALILFVVFNPPTHHPPTPHGAHTDVVRIHCILNAHCELIIDVCLQSRKMQDGERCVLLRWMRQVIF